MTVFATALVMYVLTIPMLFIMFGLLWGLASPKKNIILGVTLPYATHSDERVKKLCNGYKKVLGLTALGCFILSLGMLFARYFSVVIMWICCWMIVVIIGMYIPYLVYNHKLRKLKMQEGWRCPVTGKMVVDTKTPPMRLVSAWWFLPPFAISLVPVVGTLVRQPNEWGLALLWLVCALLVLMFYGIYLLLRRQRGDVVDDDAKKNATLTRVRRYNWTKLCLASAWLTGLFNLCFLLAMNNWIGTVICITVYTFAELAVVISAEFKTRRVQAALMARNDTDMLVDEDDFWIGGSFYYNPNDKHNMVPDRVGFGTGPNYARPLGKVLVVVIAVFFIAMPLIGLWVMRSEFTQIDVVVENGAVLVDHPSEHYEISLDDIASVELLDELPPTWRISGSSFDTLKTGRYRVEGLGECYLAVTVGAAPYLLIEAKDGTRYIFSEPSASNTVAAFALLNAKAVTIGSN